LIVVQYRLKYILVALLSGPSNALCQRATVVKLIHDVSGIFTWYQSDGQLLGYHPWFGNIHVLL